MAGSLVTLLYSDSLLVVVCSLVRDFLDQIYFLLRFVVLILLSPFFRVSNSELYRMLEVSYFAHIGSSTYLPGHFRP